MIACVSFTILLYIIAKYRLMVRSLKEQNVILISQFESLKSGIDFFNKELLKLSAENGNLTTELNLLSKEVSRLRAVAAHSDKL